MRTLLKLNACSGTILVSLVWKTNPWSGEQTLGLENNPWSGRQPLVWKTVPGLEDNPRSGRQSFIWKTILGLEEQTANLRGWVVHWAFKGQVLDLRNPDSSVRKLRFVFSRPKIVFQTNNCLLLDQGLFSRPKEGAFQTRDCLPDQESESELRTKGFFKQ